MASPAVTFFKNCLSILVALSIKYTHVRIILSLYDYTPQPKGGLRR